MNIKKTSVFFLVSALNIGIFVSVYPDAKASKNLNTNKYTKKLRMLCKNGNLNEKELGRLSKKGANFNDKDDKGRTIFHLLAEASHYFPDHIMKMLVELGKYDCLDEPDNKGFTPLHLAVKKGNLLVVNYLCDLKKQAMFSYIKIRGSGLLPITTLHSAAVRGDILAAKKLISSIEEENRISFINGRTFERRDTLLNVIIRRIIENPDQRVHIGDFLKWLLAETEINLNGRETALDFLLHNYRPDEENYDTFSFLLQSFLKKNALISNLRSASIIHDNLYLNEKIKRVLENSRKLLQKDYTDNYRPHLIEYINQNLCDTIIAPFLTGL
jgi:ankyrin repeat protein